MVQIYLEWPILAILQLFQYFPTEVVQIDSEWPILAVLQFFQYFPTKVVQIYWNGQFWLFCNFSNIFLLKWSKLIQNGQFGLLASFLIFSHQSALKLFEIATEVFRTYNLIIIINIIYKKYIGVWLRVHYDSSGFKLARCLPC